MHSVWILNSKRIWIKYLTSGFIDEDAYDLYDCVHDQIA